MLKKIKVCLIFIFAVSVYYAPLNFLFYVFFGVNFIYAIKNKGLKPFAFTKKNSTLLLLIAFLFINVVSICFSNDVYEGVKQLEKKIPLIIVSLAGIFIAEKDIFFKDVIRYNFYGAMLFVSISLIYSLYNFFWGHYGALSIVKNFLEINLLEIFEHRLYIGLLFLMVLPYVFYKMQKAKTFRAMFPYILLNLIFFYLSFSSGARILLITHLFLIIYFIQISLKNNKQVLLKYILPFAVGIIFVSLLYHPRLNLTVDLLNNKELHKIDSRAATWKSALHIIKQSPFFGVGIGDAKESLIEEYKKNNYLLESENKYNAHNQYLQTTLETGVVGGLLLLLFLLSVFFNTDINLVYRKVFIICFCSSFLVESVLNRNLGTFPFAFWIYTLICIPQAGNSMSFRKRLNNKIITLFSFSSFFILILMLIGSRVILFNSQNPSTYMTTQFTKIKHTNLPQKDKLPFIADAALINNSKSFKRFESGYFLAPEFYIGDNNKKTIADYSVWCFVSKESNIRRVFIYGWDRVNESQKNYYDLSKKGTWQKLKINDLRFDYKFVLGVRMDLYKETPNLKGNVYFANPNIVVD